MQKLKWYIRRLKAMPPDEVAYRMRASRRDLNDRVSLKRRQRLRSLSAILNEHGPDTGPGFRVTDIALKDGSWSATGQGIESDWYNSLLVRAERIVEHRLDLFDLKGKHLGNPIVWNRDHKRGQNTPMIFSPFLDYRDVNRAGDCKFVWEPNRHHQLVVLGRAYRLSGNTRFAEAVVEQLDSWLKQNPYGVGMNWRSGLELGVRLINWVWALDLIEEAAVIDSRLRHRILDSVSRHIWEIDRKYSRGSSVGNHLIGEAAGVFVATSYFPYLRNASSWLARSREILNREILNQTFSDGGPAEQAIGYHFFVLQFLVVAGLTASATDRDMPKSYWSRLEKMFEFVARLSEGGDCVPSFGDCDDGYVLDLGSDPHSIKEWLGVGTALFERSDFNAAAPVVSEPVRWLPGRSTFDSYSSVLEPEVYRCASTALRQTGYYLLQHGALNSPDRVSVVFDCGPQGMEPLAGHGHADALSFTLRAFGSDVLVDPGTYDYFSYPKWRRYFRSTRAHNTVVIDGRDQAEELGPFLWGRKVNAECLSWQPAHTGGKVIGEHDGYTHLHDPVIHKRMIDLDGRELIVRDDIEARGKHEIQIFFHFAEHCSLELTSRNTYLVDIGCGMIVIELDQCLVVESFRGSEDPICGWVSRGYHQKQASTTLVGRCVSDGDLCLICRIDLGELKHASVIGGV